MTDHASPRAKPRRTARWLPTLAMASLVASASSCLAGPCSKDIVDTQAHIDARIAAVAGAGGYGVESAGALLDRQPSPASIAAAESRLHEMPPRTMDLVKTAMVRARDEEKAGRTDACEAALGEVRRAMGP